MAIQIKYAPLFHLRLLHDSELDLGTPEWKALTPPLQDQRTRAYDISNSLRLTPTADLQPLMARHRLRIQNTPFGITVFAEVVADPDNANADLLAFPLDDDARLRLSLELTNPSFPASANLPLDGLASKTLYLSNQHEHEDQGELHLTRALPAFDSLKGYQAGDLVVDDDASPTILLEAKDALAPAASPRANDWLRLPTSLYSGGTDYQIEERVMHAGILYEAASSGTHPQPPSAEWTTIHTPSLRTGVGPDDHVQVLGPRHRFPVAAGLKFAKATLFDSEDAEVETFTFFHDTGEILSALNFDFGDHSPGFYRLEATDANDTLLSGFPLPFYLDPLPLRSDAFGIVEIFNQSGSHAILDDNGHPLAPTFHVRFRKRHTFWRYHFAGDLKDLPPDETGDLEQIDPADKSRYVTTEPLPLTTGSVPLQKFGDTFQLPNPDLSVVNPEGTKLYSDIFIHI